MYVCTYIQYLVPGSLLLLYHSIIRQEDRKKHNYSCELLLIFV